MVVRRTRSNLWAYLAAVLGVGVIIALLVGWILVVALYTDLIWLLVLGIVGLVAVAGLVGVLAVKVRLTARDTLRQRVFLDAMTHELKSPLAAVRMCAETLARPDLPHARRQPVIDMLLTDVGRLSGLIDDVLAASRLADQRFGRGTAAVELAPLIERAVGQAARRHGLGVEAVDWHVEPGCVVVGEPRALGIVFVNLIDNALKYSEGSPEVRIVGTVSDGSVVITVSDRGIGIDPRDRKRILKRFVRADHEAVRSRHGTGLGLTVAAAMIRRSGGRLDIASPGVGHGTTVTIRWPQASATPAS